MLLQLGLHVIERKREEGGKEPRDGGSAQGCREAGNAVILHHLLRLVVRREHAHVERHCAHRSGGGADEQSADALFGDNVGERVHDAGVVAALRRGERPVRLHANERQIGGGAEHGAEAARGEPRAGFLDERQRRAFVLLLEEIHHLGVDAQTRRRVGGLAQEASGDAGVQRAKTLVLDDARGDGKGAAGGTELQTDLCVCRD